MAPKPTPTMKLKHLPKQVQRRSKEEREALERGEIKRRQERAEAAAVEDAAEVARQRQKYGFGSSRKDPAPEVHRGALAPPSIRVNRGGRGGYMGTSMQSHRSTIAESGAGNHREITRPSNAAVPDVATPRPKTKTSEVGKRHSKSKSKVKDERDETDALPPIKSESDMDFVWSSSDEESGQKPRNVNEVIISDDETDRASLLGDSDAENKQRAREEARRTRLGGMPHRVSRKEHRDRNPNVNVESSNTAVASRDSGTTQDGVERGPSRKGKGRADIKTEPDPMEGLEVARRRSLNDQLLYENSDDTDVEPEPTLTSEDDGTRAAVPRHPKKAGIRHVPQTAEERNEDKLHQMDLHTVQTEFGSFAIGDEPFRDNVYLFQFPPILPDVYLPHVKTEHGEMTSTTVEDGLATAAPDKEVKSKFDHAVDNSTKHSSAGSSRTPLMEQGHVGKLRVHQSGKMTMWWGGTSLQAELGTVPEFLQTLVVMHAGGQDTEPPADLASDVDISATSKRRAQEPEARGLSGSMTSFGQIRGKFLVTPDLDEVLA